MPRVDYEQRRADRKDRYEELAAKNNKKASAEFGEAQKMADTIPFGQPIQAGHHSEGRDRNFRERIDGKFSKSFETAGKADHYDSKVQSMENNHSISQDDPEAIKKLQLKIVQEQKTHKAAKDKRLAWRKNKAAKIEELGDREYHSKYYLLAAYMTGASAEIKRCEGRIAEIQALEKVEEEKWTNNDITLEVNKDENRVMIYFSGKPDEEIRKNLKRHGFRWSYRNMAWQAYIKSQNISFAKKEILGIEAQ